MRAPGPASRAGGRRRGGRASSSWRTVPTRHGTHCPHDSSRKKAAMRRRASARSAVSSYARMTPEPSVAPAARVASKVSGRSRASGPTKTPAAPPRRTAWRRLPFAMPPASSRTSPSVAPNGVSYTPGRWTWPETQNSFGPVEAPPVPICAYAAAPMRRISGTFARVSTLLTVVGLPNSPTSTGNGGLLRGSGRPPSIDSNSAVSSPAMYAPAPMRSSMSKPVLGAQESRRPRLRDGVRQPLVAPAGTRRGGRGSRAPAPVANPAIVIASTIANGSSSSNARSLKVPGSDSSALHTR